MFNIIHRLVHYYVVVVSLYSIEFIQNKTSHGAGLIGCEMSVKSGIPRDILGCHNATKLFSCVVSAMCIPGFLTCRLSSAPVAKISDTVR